MATTHTSTGTLVPTAGAHGGPKKEFAPMSAEHLVSQLLWLTLTFCALYLVLSRISLPRIGNVIEARHDRIQRDLKEAERLNTETETALKDYETALAEAKAKAGAIAQQERAAVTAEAEQTRAEAAEKDARRMAKAESLIAQSKAKALLSVDEIATDVAGNIVSKLIGKSASVAEIKQALTEPAQ